LDPCRREECADRQLRTTGQPRALTAATAGSGRQRWTGSGAGGSAPRSLSGTDSLSWEACPIPPGSAEASPTPQYEAAHERAGAHRNAQSRHPHLHRVPGENVAD
jgi:hypothetical protein